MPRYAGLTRVTLEEGSDIPINAVEGVVEGDAENAGVLLTLPAEMDENVEIEKIARIAAAGDAAGNGNGNGSGGVEAVVSHEGSIHSATLRGTAERIRPDDPKALAQCVLVYDTDLNEFSLELIDAACDATEGGADAGDAGDEHPAKRRKTGD